MFFVQNKLILKEMGNLADILFSSPRANGPFELKNVKVSQKLTELRSFKGAFSQKKVLIQDFVKKEIVCNSANFEDNFMLSASLPNSIKFRSVWAKNPINPELALFHEKSTFKRS